MKITLELDLITIDQILNGRLRVLKDTSAIPLHVGDALTFLEKNEFDFTGRKFYAKILFALPEINAFQFELFGYMDMEGERVSIGGDYPHEAKNFPRDKADGVVFDFDGTRPAWIYAGIKWHSEVSLARLIYTGGQRSCPDEVVLRVSGHGGDTFVSYRLSNEVTGEMTAAKP